MTPPSLSQARRAYDLAHYGDASSEAQLAALHDLMAVERAAETLDERCLRLGLMAADKDAEAGRHWFAEADAAGRAAFRRLAGNDDAMAASFDREAAACRECARAAEAEARRLRSQAAAIRRSQRYAADVLASLQGGR